MKVSKKTRLSRLLLTVFLALALSAVVAPLLAAGVSAFVTHSPCIFGTVPRLIAPAAGSGGGHLLVCMDARGRLYTMDKMLVINWLIYFLPVSLLSFFLIFSSRWMKKSVK
jgi:hypothetical protein